MRIQHNIMAMNAYRNYNNNNKALSGNLEKLSSGYKINRAGDDAAGLAISEKMRAQITGLNAAQKNVKDGISLVKTAEGAMQEIQDMLNRMDYLATQSANGTYQDEVDREALQKEVNQLNEEINRIAESANFNGIKLLDGTWDADAKVRGVNTAQKALDAAKAALEKVQGESTAVAPVYGDNMSASAIKGMMLPLVANGGAGDPSKVGTNTILETEKVEFQAPSFQVSMNGTSYVMSTDGTADATDAGGNVVVDFDGTAALKLTVNSKDIAITEAEIKAYYDDQGKTVKAGQEISSEDIANIIVHKITNDTTGIGTSTPVGGGTAAAVPGNFGDGTNSWKVKADGQNVVFEFDADKNDIPQKVLNEHFDVKLTSAVTGATVKATAGSTSYTVTNGKADTGAASTGNTKVTLKATIDGKEVDFGSKNDVAADATAANIKAAADALAAVEGTDADGNKYKFSDYFDISINGQTITFTDKTTGAEGSGNSVALGVDTSGVTLGTANGDGAKATLGDATPAKGTDAYTTGLTGYVNYGTEVVISGVPSVSEQLASTTLDLSKVDIVDGMKIKLGDTEYTFAVGAKSTVDLKGENVIDLTDMEADKLVKGNTVTTEKETAVSRLSEAAKDNKIFTVSHQGTDAKLGLKQKAEVKETTDMSTLDNFAGYISISSVDAEATKKAQEAAEAAKQEKVNAAQAKVTEAQKALTDAEGIEGGKALNLQIGDTSDDFNQLGVKIGSMRTTALGVDGLSISTAEDAAQAIDTVKTAINYVSSVRGDLGAYQNRLEHTSNNLSVMAENIQDAESTIRDTDVAEEMMSYVKNNILVQSAQAMLAQANQVPQGVLQLLG